MFRIQASENSVNVYRQKGSDVVKYSATSDRVVELSTVKNVKMTECRGDYFLTKDGICTTEFIPPERVPGLMHGNLEEFKNLECLRVNYKYLSAIKNRHVVFFHRETMRQAFELKLDPSCIDMDDKTLLVCSGNQVNVYSLNSILVRSGFDWAEKRYQNNAINAITACALYGGVVILCVESQRCVIITNTDFSPVKVIHIDPCFFLLKRRKIQIKVYSWYFLILNGTQALLFNFKSGELLRKFECDDAQFYNHNIVIIKNGIVRYISIVDGEDLWEQNLQDPSEEKIIQRQYESIFTENKFNFNTGRGSETNIFNENRIGHEQSENKYNFLNNFFNTGRGSETDIFNLLSSIIEKRMGQEQPEVKVTGLDTVTDDEKKQCRICCENLANVCYVPCGHVFSCVACCNANPSNKCAFCRSVATSYVKVYLPE